MSDPDHAPMGLSCLGCGQHLGGDQLESDIDQAVALCPACGPVAFTVYLNDRGERDQGYVPLSDPRFRPLPEPDPYF